MATFNLTDVTYYTGATPNNAYWTKQNSSIIITGSGVASSSNGGHSSAQTKIQFKTPSFLNSKIKVTIQVKGTAPVYQNAKYAAMALSETSYEPGEVVDNNQIWSVNGISTTLKNNCIGGIAIGSLSGDVATFKISDVELKPNKTYYLYFLRYKAPGIYQNGTTFQGYAALLDARDDVSVSLNFDDIVQLSSPTIETKNQVLPYNNSITVNWGAVSSKTNNTISGYRVFLRVGSNPTESSYKIKADTTSTSHTFSLKNIARGEKIYIGVQAISSYEQYKTTYPDILKNCNSAITTLHLGNINSLPSRPTLSKSSSTVGGNQSIIFSNFSSSDVDNQTITYYYSLNSTTKNKISGSSLSLTLDSLRNIDITETGTYEIKFYAYDTKEYSSANTISFTAEFAPVVTARSASITTVEGGNSTSCLDTVVLNYTLQYSASDLTPQVYVHVGSNYNTKKTLDSQCYSVSGEIITIKVANIPTDQVAHGAKFKVSFEIKNSGNLSSGTGNQLFGEYTRPVKLAASSITSRVTLENDATTHGTSWDNHFKKYIYLTLGAMPKASNRPIVSKITLITRDKNNTLRTASLTESKKNSLGMNNAIPKAGDWATLAVRVTDKAGQITETEVLGKYYRVGALNFPQNGNYVISKTSINPCITGESFTITHPTAVNASSSEITVSYKYSYSINGSNIQFSTTKASSSTNTTIEANTSNITKLKEDILKVVDKTANFNGIGTIAITATDDFGQVVTYSGLNLTADTRTAPSFGSNRNFILRHNYDISRDLTTQAIEIGNSAVATYKPEIFNSGEKIVFQIPKPTDENDDIVSLKIYLYRNNLPMDETAIKSYDSKDVTFNSWLTIPITSSSLIKKSDYYYYNYTTSPYSKNEYFYFKITAVDSLGAESSALTNSHYIIGARTVPSQIKVTSNSAQIEQSEDNTKATVKLNFNLEILDLGGSAGLVSNKVSWNTDYYNLYPNFNRAAYYSNDNNPQWVNMIDYKWVQVEISPTADFPSGEVRVKKIRLETLQKEWKINNLEWEFTDFKSGANRVYVRVRLLVPYALTNTNSTSVTRAQVQGTPFVYSFFDQSPTVAYRPHQVGINVKNVNTEAVLEISPFDNYKKIILKRDSDKSIVINIDQLTIDGIIIESGSW